MPSKATIPLACDQCGTGFLATPREQRRGRRFCSHACRVENQHGRQFLPLPSPMYDGDTARIPLHNSRGDVVAHAIVDADKAEWVSQWRWHVNRQGYTVRFEIRQGVREMIRLHRALLGLARGDQRQGDHLNRDRLDNRLANLRIVSLAANNQNRTKALRYTSQYRGVSWHKQSGKWRAQVKVNRSNHYLGTFSDELEAAEAAREGRRRLLAYAVD